MGNCKPKTTKAMEAKFVEYQDAIRQITEHPKVPDEALKNVSTFAERLNMRLNDLNMTQSEFATCAGISAQTVGMLLKGKRSEINREHLYLYAAILRCSPHYLLGLENDFTLYPPEKEGEKPGRNPIVWKSSSEQKILDSLSRVAQEDPVFVDYIFQIVESGKTENVKDMLLAAELVKKRKPKTFSIFHKTQGK